MNPEVKQKWIEALRSGKYKQGKKQLRSSIGFCCLGVLCDLYSKEHPEAKWEVDYFLGERTILPKEVMEWAGMSHLEGCVQIHKNQSLIHRYLSTVNDSGSSFEEIADLIEQNIIR